MEAAKSWTNYRDPVCPLRLALYGHPDSGGIWEKHCTKQLKSIGWVPVLPDIWQSISCHPELDLLLVVYVEDFKMAGPKVTKGWEGISKVLEMDPAEPLRRCFGCHHVEKTLAKLDRSVPPLAYVFDKQETAAGVDSNQFPMLGTQRITEMDDGTSKHDDYNKVGPSRMNPWWTGKTLFPIMASSEEEFRVAVAARKGRPMRSKSEAEREAKQQRSKGTETIVDDAVPSMNKPVNIMFYDMRDFLVSSVDKYCEFAGVGLASTWYGAILSFQDFIKNAA
ncbi:unnamed protein product, partial [Symbiodinium necroappetens]